MKFIRLSLSLLLIYFCLIVVFHLYKDSFVLRMSSNWRFVVRYVNFLAFECQRLLGRFLKNRCRNFSYLLISIYWVDKWKYLYFFYGAFYHYPCTLQNQGPISLYSGTLSLLGENCSSPHLAHIDANGKVAEGRMVTLPNHNLGCYIRCRS